MKAHVKHLIRGEKHKKKHGNKNLAILRLYGHTIARAQSQFACKHISPPLPPPFASDHLRLLLCDEGHEVPVPVAHLV